MYIACAAVVHTVVAADKLRQAFAAHQHLLVDPDYAYVQIVELVAIVIGGKI
jgi:hypothetical protein